MKNQENINDLLDFLKSLSLHSVEILLRYPDWRTVVFEAFYQAPLPLDFLPVAIEVFDQKGLMVGRINDYTYTVQLEPNHVSEFTAWYFDGELVLFYVGDELIVNRLQLVSIAALFDSPINAVR